MSKKVYVILCAVMTFVGVMAFIVALGIRSAGSLEAALVVLRSEGAIFDPETPAWLNVAMGILVFVLPVVLSVFIAVASWENRGIFGRVMFCLLGAPLLGVLLSFVGVLMWGLMYIICAKFEVAATLVALLLLIVSAMVPTVVVYRVTIERIR